MASEMTPGPTTPEPALQRLTPGVMAASKRHEPRYRLAEVMFTDHQRRYCDLLAWASCQAGWAALVRWPDGPDGW